MPLPEAAAGAAVLTLYGMAPLVWSNAIVTEVYALASLLLWSVLYAAVRAWALRGQQAARKNAVGLTASGVLLGLGEPARIVTVALGGPALAALSTRATVRPFAVRLGALPVALAALGFSCRAARFMSTCRSPRRWTRQSTGARRRRRSGSGRSSAARSTARAWAAVTWALRPPRRPGCLANSCAN